MKIIIKGPLRTVIGNELFLELSMINGDKIKDLANYIRNMFIEKARKRGLEEALTDFFSHNVIIINGVEISVLDGENTKINDNDEILIINITHGG